ncbi:MAG TPA: hypothetical protein VNM90_05885 [Haliangium sp.]|nr:hypothetical protein [Haliangium sp.]
MLVALAAGLVTGASAGAVAGAQGPVAGPQAASSVFERELPGRLARAIQAGRRSELARLGARAGAGGLRPILMTRAHESPQGWGAAPTERAAWLAAVLAAPAAEDAWDLLSPLAVLAAGPDRTLATSAASSAADIATRLDRDWHALYEVKDIAPTILAAAQQSWLDLAADPGRWVDVRVLALEIGVSLGRVLHLFADDARASTPRGPARPPGEVLAERAIDAEPALRRAAFELMDEPLLPAQRALAGKAVADPEPEVALAAAQALCSGLGLGAAPAPILAALDEPGRARLRDLIADPAHAPAARIDAARCLAAMGDAPSRRALEALRASLPRDLRGLTPREPRSRRSRGHR